ncbi:MAG TPA: CAP domain-containing protein [Candidatus Saccharimonadales bacterium]|nr:CAP domain-containing protein [Candidatus Saccharimonadales bacterium]
MSALKKIASTKLSVGLAHFLIPHSKNDHHPLILRHESLFVVTFVLLFIQFFSFAGFSPSHVLGYGTDINKDTLITLTNQERSSRGIATLKESAKLDQSATLKGEDMFAKDYWAHFAPDGTSPWYFFTKVGYTYNWAGENLARDFSTSAGVIAGWMASQGHRDNMLNPNFQDIGISVQNGTLQGDQTTLVVEHLGTVKGASTSGSSPTTPTSGTTNSNKSKPTNVEDKFLPVAGTSQPQEANSSADLPKIEEKVASAVTPFSFNPVDFWASLGLGQKTTLLLLAILVGVFLFDSVVVFRKGIARHNSHSLLHAIVLSILIVAIVRSATGGVL